MPLDDLYKKITVLEEFDIVKETMEIIEENSAYLADLLSLQLSKGIDGEGNPVTLRRRGGVYDYYSDRTVFNKEHFGGGGLGSVTAYVTNYMSGAFYKEMFVTTKGTDFEIESNVPYFEKIISQSGIIIMQLSQEHLDMFTENILKPQLEERFSTRWNGV